MLQCQHLPPLQIQFPEMYSDSDSDVALPARSTYSIQHFPSFVSAFASLSPSTSKPLGYSFSGPPGLQGIQAELRSADVSKSSLKSSARDSRSLCVESLASRTKRGVHPYGHTKSLSPLESSKDAGSSRATARKLFIRLPSLNTQGLLKSTDRKAPTEPQDVSRSYPTPSDLHPKLPDQSPTECRPYSLPSPSPSESPVRIGGLVSACPYAAPKMAQCRHSVNLDDITFGDDGSRGSPVFYLTYFQMHLDFVDLTCSTELQRHQLVRLNERQTLLSAPAIDICSAPLNLLPGLQDEFDKSIRSASFFLLKMNIDLGYTYSGVCKNIAIYESLRYRTIECTTSIHSFGKKILETTEMRYPLNQDDRLIYRFDFAGDFFNTFLNGFSQLETYSEAVWAIENLTVMQIYKDIDAGNAPTTVLCLAFVFEPGAGGIDVLRLKDYGYTD